MALRPLVIPKSRMRHALARVAFHAVNRKHVPKYSLAGASISCMDLERCGSNTQSQKDMLLSALVAEQPRHVVTFLACVGMLFC
jgi:hypothetical protein